METTVLSQVLVTPSESNMGAGAGDERLVGLTLAGSVGMAVSYREGGPSGQGCPDALVPSSKTNSMRAFRQTRLARSPTRA